MVKRLPASESPRPHLLLIEDDEGVRRSLQLLLHARGFDVRAYAAATPAVNAADQVDYAALVSDYRLPDGDGIGVLRAMKRNGWSGKAVLITGFPSPHLFDSARACGFDAVLEKPLRTHDLVDALNG
ncbi:response regulator [Sphingomonas sp.]|uniref:response regulator n=1 Tax=Sphingomonas sp. TaxID=28214 RepID=UPI001E1A3183|nr:response regulator [Sphingomonas sp.]MBX9797502.1 response regulator [Sphingomonas sp.]